MNKVREAMKPSGNYLMDGKVHVDEFVVGGKEPAGATAERKKVVCAVQLTKGGKVKRFYALQVMDFSAKSLRPISESHISKEAKVTTDEWKGYRPIAKDFNITQIPSDFGLNFKALHTAIHQVKSWIRTTFSWVGKRHIERYLNEYPFGPIGHRTNRRSSTSWSKGW